jgi:hypothetical protein
MPFELAPGVGVRKSLAILSSHFTENRELTERVLTFGKHLILLKKVRNRRTQVLIALILLLDLLAGLTHFRFAFS